MKKLLLHIILISYTALLFKPVMPCVNDFAGHIFFYAKHIATVHEENGRFHVHLEAANNVNEQNNKEASTPSSSKKDNTVTEYCFFIIDDEPFFGNSLHLNYLLRNKNEVCIGSIQKNYTPPRW